MTDRKLCPLTFAVDPEAVNNAHYRCVEEACAWWTVSDVCTGDFYEGIPVHKKVWGCAVKFISKAGGHDDDGE